ncbi:MAG: hypothetical protein WCF33_24955 [Pseudonocardiaceae bacterium]
MAEAEEGATWLENLLDIVTGDAIKRCVEGLSNLVPGGASRAEVKLVARAVNDSNDTLFVGRAASTLLESGRIEGAARLLASLVAGAQGRAQSLASIHDCIVISSAPDSSTSHARRKLLTSWWNDSEATSMVAEWASQAGLRDEALWSARRTLADETATADDIQRAGRVLLGAGGSLADEVTRMLYSRHPWYAVKLITDMREAGKLEDAYSLAVRALEGPLMGSFTIKRLSEAWIACDEWSVNDLVRRIKESRHNGPEYLAALALALAKAGETDESSALAQCVLKDSRADSWDFGNAIDALLATKSESAPEVILSLCANASSEHVFAAIDKLCEHEQLPKAVELIGQFSSDDIKVDLYSIWAFKKLHDASEDTLVKGILSELVDRDGMSYYRSELALTLAKFGLNDHVKRLFHNSLHDDATSSYEITRFIKAWLITRGASCAAELVTIIKHHALSAELQLAVADELAKQGLLPLAVDVWMHMLSTQERSPEYALTAIARLVAFGCGENLTRREIAGGAGAAYPIAEVARTVASWLSSSSTTLKTLNNVSDDGMSSV